MCVREEPRRQGNVRRNVTLTRVREIILLVRKEYSLHILSVCVCILSYPARKAHAPCYIVIGDLYGRTIYFHIIS